MKGRICSKGLWDETVPGIEFDAGGVSNYCRLQEAMMREFPRGEAGRQIWMKIAEKIRAAGKNKKYDCVIGVSGGTDSSYLLHLARAGYDLRPLAVNLDNGWNSDIAVQNIKKVTKALGIDLETYVIDYEEIKDLLRVYMKAGLPWIDSPTDLAIQAVLFKIAAKEGIQYILIGNDFRSEGKQPTEWTYSDSKQLKYLHRKYGRVKLKSYPLMSVYEYFWYGIFKGIKMYYPYHYLDYDKQSARKFLMENYDWQYYGEHHHENLFTKWAIGYWMYEKFGIDKRKITYSAQILNGVISREEALQVISKKPFTEAEAREATAYVLKKLDLSEEDFSKIWNSGNHTFLDYPSYYRVLKKYAKPISRVLKHLFGIKPKIFMEMNSRK